MRRSPPPDVERGRVTKGPRASDESWGMTGMFQTKLPGTKTKLNIVVSDGLGWEHVSVSVLSEMRTPSWEEMCIVKNWFWRKDETVIQYHPAEEDYVNCHATTLHLWKPTDAEIPKPDPMLVGPKTR